MRQTPRSFIFVIEGCAKRAERDRDRTLMGAWHGEAFARSKRLKGLAHYLGIKDRGVRDERAVLSMFRTLQSKTGFSVKITRVERKEPTA